MCAKLGVSAYESEDEVGLSPVPAIGRNLRSRKKTNEVWNCTIYLAKIDALDLLYISSFIAPATFSLLTGSQIRSLKEPLRKNSLGSYFVCRIPIFKTGRTSKEL